MGVASHQALDLMWQSPRNWLFPFLGAARRIETEGWFLRELLLELRDPLEWVSAAALLVLLLPVLWPAGTSALVARYGRGLRVLALGAVVPLAALGLYLIASGGLRRAVTLGGWKDPWINLIGGAVLLLTAYAAYRLSVRLAEGPRVPGARAGRRDAVRPGAAGVTHRPAASDEKREMVYCAAGRKPPARPERCPFCCASPRAEGGFGPTVRSPRRGPGRVQCPLDRAQILSAHTFYRSTMPSTPPGRLAHDLAEAGRPPADLAAAVGWTVLTLLSVYLPVVNETPLRVLFGLPLILFVPGYVLIAALFPRNDDLDWLERVALSFGLSIAVVPLIGLVLNYTPWGIRLDPVLAALSLFVIAMAAAAAVRRLALPVGDRLTVPAGAVLASARSELFAPGQSRLDRNLSILLLVSIVAAIGTTAFVIAVPKEGEHFSEFYVLGANGKAADYPTVVPPEDAPVGDPRRLEPRVPGRGLHGRDARVQPDLRPGHEYLVESTGRSCSTRTA